MPPVTAHMLLCPGIANARKESYYKGDLCVFMSMYV